MVIWAIGLPSLYQAMATPCEPNCEVGLISSGDIASLEAIGLSAEFYGAWMILLEFVVVVPYSLCCLLLLWTLTDNWSAWVASLIFAGSSLIVNGFVYGLPEFGVLGELADTIFSSIYAAAMPLFVFLFPSGRFFRVGYAGLS